MSKTIKSIKTLEKHLGETVHVVSYDGYEFDAKIVDNLRGNFTGLFTTDKAAENDSYWWEGGTDGYCHIITKPYQLKIELKSITLLEDKGTKGKAKKTTKKTFVCAQDLLANQGHYCEMADGSKGFIAGSEYPHNVCVLHNCEDSEGWTISKSYRETEIKEVSKDFIKLFSKGWHVGDDDEAEEVRVVKILPDTETNSNTKFLTRSELLKGVGHFCELSDGSKGFICKTQTGNPRVLHNAKRPLHGWSYDPADYFEDDAPKALKKTFSRAFNITDDGDAEHVQVVKILKEGVKKSRAKRKKVTLTDFQASESKKSFLTREQLLEHIGKRCKMSDGTEGLIVKTDIGNPRILMNTRANGNGWLYPDGSEDDTGATTSVKSQYKYAWNVCDKGDAEDISVVEILADEKPAESSKTILDMTVKELLEKLNEIIIGQ